MKLTHAWVPPEGTLESCAVWNNHIVYTRCFLEQRRIEDQEVQVTRYGLWMVDCETGESSHCVAPFFRMGNRVDPSRGQRFMARGLDQSGSMVFSLGKGRSYDIAYFVFTFDGKTWRQVEAIEPPCGQEFVLSERRLRDWGESKVLEDEGWVLAGGELLSIPTTMTFAVDNTHAFAYDSGPDSPHSEAYLRAQETLSKLRSSADDLTYAEQQAVLDLLPEDVRKQKSPRYWKYFMRKIGEAFYVSDSRSGGSLVGLLRVG